MHKTKVFIIYTIIQLSVFSSLFSQSSSPDFMQSIGKIYVVVAVIITIFIGIIIYLIALERKIKKLEEQIGK